MKKIFLAFLASLIILILIPSYARSSNIREKSLEDYEYVEDELIIKFKLGTRPSQIEEIKRQFSLNLLKDRKFADFITIKLPSGVEPARYAELLRVNRLVEYAEPNYLVYASMVPNDPYYLYQWHFPKVNAEEAWDLSSGKGVVVAIIDTGIAYENYRERGRTKYEIAPDLKGTCFVGAYDFVNNDSHANDDEGHGTHVAGTVAQTTNNKVGVAGLAFSACLMPVKVLNNKGVGTYADVAEGIRYASDNGAKVINLSLGGSSPSQALEGALAYAYSKGVVIVAAAGNESLASLNYPAAYNDYVIAVGATRYDDSLASYSNYGADLDLVAPGGDISVDQNGDGYGDGVLQQTFDKNPTNWGYWFYQGTSMATPHVSGVSAMLISKGVNSPENVRNILQETAKDLGIAGRDDMYGWGLVDAYAALQNVGNPVPTSTPTPTPEPVATATPTPTAVPTPTPTPTPTATPTPTLAPSPTPTPTPEPKPWWCRYVPSHPFCQ